MSLDTATSDTASVPPALVDLQSIAVMVVEDEPDVARTFCMFIKQSGMRTFWADSGRLAMRGKTDFRPDVVLVDMGLPDTHGLDLIRWLVKCGDCGIIVVSGSSEESERVVGIELGADDYVVKPPSMRELVARIRAVHRRVGERRMRSAWLARSAVAAPAGTPGRVTIGTVEVDLRRREVVGPAGVQELTDAECRTLMLLLEAEGRPVSRDRICETALNRKLGFEDRSVDQLILKVRRKLGADEGSSRLISSVRGAGYALQI
jgi:DNA-binding response OmpR family regulator